ncbi:hypothetical protein GCM10011611_60860 [Aliidongia dinghuensis]|uniref:PA14 domain-containing protein n=1 Tax=Aliidongia dinghuensis TaxID=1867774 RepID=A0A8J3E6M9_9PROT|nr:PA14 domain-containing protein [Aliidongia dinghuensis]GGF46214.1 hypothetical protein GCM10011611_60860 [Aliidongia dinghuensis]
MVRRLALRTLAACLLPACALSAFPPGRASAQGVVDGGFVGSYYANPSFSTTPAFQRRDNRIDFTWTGSGVGGSSSPEFAGVGRQAFSAGWTGRILPATSETYSFALTTAGAVALYIRPAGNHPWTTLIADFGSSPRARQGTVALEAGRSYELLLYYWQYGPQGQLSLDWGSPTIPMATLDAATPLGVNIAYTSPNDPSLIFADAVMQAAAFQVNSNYASFNAPAPVDAQGWPTTDATLPLWSVPREPEGTYLLSFTGQAQVVDWLGIGSFSVGGVAYGATLPAGAGYDPASNTTTAEWVVPATASPTSGAFLGFVASQRTPDAAVGSGVTNVHLMRPLARGSASSHPLGELFTADFKKLVSNFTVIRYMDYLATYANNQRHWSDRVKPTDRTQYQAQAGYGWQGKGAAWEYAVELANETGKDMWINLPLQVDDDYVTKVAELLAFGSDGTNPYTAPQANPVYPPLDPNLKVYVEYSNELWNTAFPMYHQNCVLAQQEVAAGGSPLNFDGSTSTAVWAHRRVAERTREISDLFRAVWGDAGMMSRVRPVLEWQYGDAHGTGSDGLKFLETYYGNADGQAHVANPQPVSHYLWGGGGAWYALPVNPEASTIAAIYASGLDPSLPGTTAADAAWTLAYGLQELGYEGGFYVGANNVSVTNSAAQTDLQNAANLDPAASAFEAETIDLFFEKGGNLPLVFTTSGEQYGIVYPTIHDQDTPKMRAILAAIDGGRPAATIGTPAPGTLPVSSAAVATGATQMQGALTKPGDFVGWSVNLPSAGTYSVTTDAGTATPQILIDGVPVGTGSWTGPLGQGLHGIRIRATGPVAINNLIVTQ